MEATAAGDCSAPSVVLDGEHEHGVQEMAAKLRVVLVGSEKAGSGENGCGGELCSAINGGREQGRGERPGERAVGGAERLGAAQRPQNARRRQGTRQEVGALGSHGCHALATRRHFDEQVASAIQRVLEAVFGLVRLGI